MSLATYDVLAAAREAAQERAEPPLGAWLLLGPWALAFGVLCLAWERLRRG